MHHKLSVLVVKQNLQGNMVHPFMFSFFFMSVFFFLCIFNMFATWFHINLFTDQGAHQSQPLESASEGICGILEYGILSLLVVFT